MIARLLVLALWLALGSAHATTYLVTLCPDGTPCRLAEIDSATEAKNGWSPGKAPVPVDGSCPLCQVVDPTTYAGYQAALVKKSTIISKAAFLARFTPADDPGLLKRLIAVSRTNDDVAQWFEIARARDTIDLTDPLTKQGLDAFVQAGLISAAREIIILTP